MRPGAVGGGVGQPDEHAVTELGEQLVAGVGGDRGQGLCAGEVGLVDQPAQRVGDLDGPDRVGVDRGATGQAHRGGCTSGKADGRQRPLGLATLKGKIAQRGEEHVVHPEHRDRRARCGGGPATDAGQDLKGGHVVRRFARWTGDELLMHAAAAPSV
ncbi:MAG: hypothetical protein ACRDRH_04845 [Pseudonocardia sp.]